MGAITFLSFGPLVSRAFAVPTANPDPGLCQVVKMLAPDGAPHDRFGCAVAMSGDTAVICAPSLHFVFDRTETGLGSAYVFVRSGTGWIQQAKLTSSDATAYDHFGYSVALSGDTVLLGADGDDTTAGVNAGSAYVFTRSGTGWTQQAKLTASDGAAGDHFGFSVALEGDTAIIGALYDDTTAGVDAGSAYVFTRSGTIWTEQAKIASSDGVRDDLFGSSVCLSGGTAIVGATGSSLSTSPGSAYAFTRSGSSWTQQAKLMASDGAAGDWFGVFVAASGDTAVVGAYQDDDKGSCTGSAYVFTRSGTSWTQQAKLIASDAASWSFFGSAVAISGDTVAIGALGSFGSAPGGTGYVFTRGGTTWTERARLTASDGVFDDCLGDCIAMMGSTLLIGAPRAHTAAGQDAGAAYFFDGLTSLSTTEDVPLAVGTPGVLANDTDTAGDALTATLPVGPAHGTLALAADGSFTYTPTADWWGTDHFHYRASDGATLSEAATVTIAVTPVNDAPVAHEDATTTPEDVPLTVCAPGVLANDTDVDTPHSSLAATLVSDASTGTLVLAADGGYTYAPPAGWSGDATFRYRVFDGELYSNAATVTITVDAPADACSDAYSVSAGTTLTVVAPGVLANDIHVPTSALSAVIASPPAHAAAMSLAPDGGLVYRSAAGYSGIDTFTYRAFDGVAYSAPATVTVTVTPKSVTRVAGPDRYATGVAMARKGWDPAGTKMWPGVKNVVIASGEDRAIADPLSAAGLCGIYDAPLLLVPGTGVLPASVRNVITEIASRNKPITVYIVGGTAAVPAGTSRAIDAISGVSAPIRVAGADRYGTSAAIADRVIAVKGVGAIPGSLLVCAEKPTAYFDALAAGPIAYHNVMPILAVKTGSVPSSIKSVLTRLGSTTRYAVSAPAYLGASASGATRLVTSTDRYIAATQIAEAAKARGWLAPTDVGIASKLPDALGGGAFMGRKGGVLLYTTSTASMQATTRNRISANRVAITGGWVFGGTAVMPEAQKTQFYDLIR